MRVMKLAATLALLNVLLAPNSWGQEQSETEEPKTLSRGKTNLQKKDDEGWKPLLPKTGLEGWEATDFGTDAKVSRDGDLLVIEMGDPMNGITYKKGDFPKDNFEIQLEAKRVEGNDFLCGLTFPVGGKEQYCSLIAGGWGGSIVGLSSVDGVDASENATTTYEQFENGKWYKFRVRVDPEFVTVWINDKKFFYQERDGHVFETRIEVWGSHPLGFCTYQSKVHVRNFVWRPITKSGTDKTEAKATAAVGDTSK